MAETVNVVQPICSPTLPSFPWPLDCRWEQWIQLPGLTWKVSYALSKDLYVKDELVTM